jgi:hypothetical protein
MGIFIRRNMEDQDAQPKPFEMYVKTYGHIEKATKLAEGEVEFVVSTNAWDSHGERIDVDGIDLKDYKKNPVILWAHDGFNLPIGKTTKIWKENGKLMARAQFYMKDEFPRKVYNYIIDGFLNAASIGGQVQEWAADGLTIKGLLMKEWSVVPLPANQEALVASKSMDGGAKAEFNGLARSYARKVLSEGNNSAVVDNIHLLESLVATLKELAISETHEAGGNRQVVLRQAQAVDNQAETVIRSIKLKGTINGN